MEVISHTELTLEKAKAGCFVIGMPNDDYHSYDGVSKSGLDLVNRSPAHYAYAEPIKQTRAMAIGSAIHCAILEEDRFKAEYVLLHGIDDRRKSEYKQAVKVHDESKVLVSHEAKRVETMMQSALSDQDVRNELSLPGYCELSAFAMCPETGVLIRARFDKLSKSGRALDLKKTQDARPREFAKSVFNYRYHVQDALYSYVYQLITGKPLEVFQILAVEEIAPCTAAMYIMDDEAKEIGEYYLKKDLSRFAECDKNNEWPHPEVGGSLSLPYYAVSDYEEQLEVNL